MSSRVTGATTASTLTYNALDQLQRWSGTTASASNEEWYLYDATGNRVLRRSANTTSSGNPATASATITVYAFGLAEHQYSYFGSGSSATTTNNTYYYSLNGKLLGTLSGTSTLKTSFLLTDSVGSVVTTISNTAGSAAVLGTQVYGPYGNKRTSAGAMGTAKGFTGQYADDLTGFDYYVARYYDPVVARFLSADTVQGNMQGMDPYDYVGGNPETRNDPTGHCWPVCTMLIGAAIGAAVGAGVSIGSQMASGHSVNWGEVGKQAAVGAISGAVSGLAGPEAGVLAHAAIGAAAGAVGQATSNAIDHKPIGDGVLEAAAIGGVTGGIAKGVGPLMNKAGSAIISKVGDTIGATATDAVETASSTAASACGLSFSADTQVATPSGAKAINTLAVGDQVQAFDPATNKQSTQTVQHVFINHDTDLLDVTLTLDAGSPITAHGLTGTSKQQQAAVVSHGSHAPPSTQSSSTETIHTTQSHPWLTTKGWITAGKLHLGDHILRLDGTTARVTNLHAVAGEQDMWDLTVSKVHTFAVGDGQWVVHNCDIRMDPRNIRFTQGSITNQGEGYTVQGNIRSLQNGQLNPDSMPTIRVFTKTQEMEDWFFEEGAQIENGRWSGDPSNLENGKIYSLDNRRLYAFQKAGITGIPVRFATKEEILAEMWKFTTPAWSKGQWINLLY